jgi:spore coat polysaccharide biosynthesis protein SpsF (cytidylyltransferase family)
VILATSDDPDDDMLAQFAARQGLPVFRGSLVDVLSRAVGACHQLGLSHMLRLCGDRPYFDVDEAKVAIQHARRDPGIDFISNRIDGKPAPGLTTELISTSALEKAAAATRCDQSREHITTFHYRNLSLFRSLSILDSPSWEELGAFAVDTADDLARLQPLSDWTPCIEFASVSAYLRAR